MSHVEIRDRMKLVRGQLVFTEMPRKKRKAKSSFKQNRRKGL